MLINTCSPIEGGDIKILESDSDARKDSYLMGSHSLVFATLAEAQNECHNLPQRPESIKNDRK